MSNFPRVILWIGLFLAVPIVPFLLFGDWLEPAAEDWVRQPGNGGVGFSILVTGLLAGDILLPVPSSVVCLSAGQKLGIPLAIGVCWAGLTLGGIGAFFLVRWFGRPVVERLTKPEQLEQTSRWVDRYGAAIIILLRPVPVLAEAGILWLATTRIGLRTFIVTLAVANLFVTIAYVSLAAITNTPVAFLLSIVIPLSLLAVVKLATKGRAPSGDPPEKGDNEPG